MDNLKFVCKDYPMKHSTQIFKNFSSHVVTSSASVLLQDPMENPKAQLLWNSPRNPPSSQLANCQAASTKGGTWRSSKLSNATMQEDTTKAVTTTSNPTISTKVGQSKATLTSKHPRCSSEDSLTTLLLSLFVSSSSRLHRCKMHVLLLIGRLAR